MARRSRIRDTNSYLKEGRYITEKLDCTVIALSYAFNLDYSYAHKLCKDKGRKDGHRFTLMHVIGMLSDYVYFVFKSGDGRYVKFFEEKKIRVSKFRDLHPTGTYMVVIPGHILTIIDGVIYNNQNNNRFIKHYWHITKEIE